MFLTIAMLIGIILYANYVDCDPVLGGSVTSRDAIVPLFVVQVSISQTLECTQKIVRFSLYKNGLAF